MFDSIQDLSGILHRNFLSPNIFIIWLARQILLSQIKLRHILFSTMVFRVIPILIVSHKLDRSICIAFILLSLLSLVFIWFISFRFWSSIILIFHLFLFKSYLLIIWIENMLVHMLNLFQCQILFHQTILCEIILPCW